MSPALLSAMTLKHSGVFSRVVWRSPGNCGTALNCRQRILKCIVNILRDPRSFGKQDLDLSIDKRIKNIIITDY